MVKIKKDDARSVKKLVSSYLQVALQAVIVYAIPEIPRNDSGKIKYNELDPGLGEKVA